MSTDLTWRTSSSDSAATVRLGERLGAKLRGGEIIELISDVGGGKTTFVKGVASGAGSSDQVASPSFTISREYQASNFTIYHLDFYRLQDAGVVANELAEFLDDPQAVILVEWAEIVEDVLPAERLQITITAPQPEIREFSFKYPSKLQYLIPEKT